MIESYHLQEEGMDVLVMLEENPDHSPVLRCRRRLHPRSGPRATSSRCMERRVRNRSLSLSRLLWSAIAPAQ